MTETRVCDVCQVVDGDLTLKECEFCNRCQGWICKPDLTRWDRRARAMIKLWGNQVGPGSHQKKITEGCGDCGKKGK